MTEKKNCNRGLTIWYLRYFSCPWTQRNVIWNRERRASKVLSLFPQLMRLFVAYVKAFYRRIITCFFKGWANDPFKLLRASEGPMQCLYQPVGPHGVARESECWVLLSSGHLLCFCDFSMPCEYLSFICGNSCLWWSLREKPLALTFILLPLLFS